MRNIFLGGGARLARYIRNDVGRGMVRDAVADLRDGNQLVLFPEGTRTVARAGQRLQARHHADRAAGAGADPDRHHRERSRRTSPRAGRCCRRRRCRCVSALRLGRRFAPRGRSPRPAAPPRALLRRGAAAGERGRVAWRATHLVLIPSYNTGADWSTTRCAPRARLVAGLGGRRRQHRRHRRRAARAGRRRPGPARRRAGAQPRQGRGGAARARARRSAAGLHARADDGLRRPASGRPDPRVHGGLGGAARGDDPRPAGVRRHRRRCCACAGGASRTGGPTSRRCGAGIDDSLYGFRVYPIAPLVEVMRGQRWMRRFDFDPEAVVRLAWRGVTPINIAGAGEVPARPRRAASRTSATGATTRC